MFESLQHHKKRILIAIDDVLKSKEMISFASAFQLYVRDNLPVFLLMTWLHENIEELQNVKNLTFLYKAPKLMMEPLQIRLIQDDFVEVLGVDSDTALTMARETKGYPYAFQLVGYFTWKNKCLYNDRVREEWRLRLNDYAYDIIWKSLSEKDRFVAYGIAISEANRTQEVCELLKLDKNEFSPYRRRLIKKGLVNGDSWGIVSFTLPYFAEYVRQTYEEDHYE